MGSGKLVPGIFVAVLVLALQVGFTSKSVGAESSVVAATAELAEEGRKMPVEAAEPNQGEPKIVFESTTHDFGPVSPGSSNECEFNFRNIGTGILKIEKVSKTCGCTPFTLEKKEYNPGEEGTIKVKYNADRGAGVRTRKLHVYSNDKRTPNTELTIKAAIVEKVVYEPSRLDYAMRGENADVAELTIRSVDEKAFSILELTSTSNAVTADFDPDKKASQFVLKTKIDPQKMNRRYNGRIEINVNHPECSRITVPFSILPRFRVDPPAINVLTAEPGETVHKELWVLNNYDEDFEITSTSAKAGTIKVVSQEKLGSRYKLNIEIKVPPERNAMRMFSDMLSISFEDGEKIDVGLRGFYRHK